MDWSNIYGLKFIFSFIGGALLIIGSTLEPNIAIWVISLGGTLLTASLGSDKTITKLIFYLIIGMGWGIFGSQVIHSITSIPQIAAAFFSSMFGAEMTWYIMRALQHDDFGDFLLELVSRINPFNALKKK